MNGLPTERVFIYQKVDLEKGTIGPIEVAFSDLPDGAMEWVSIGELMPTCNGYIYAQISQWPKPEISAYILRTIADRIDTLNRRAQAKPKA